VQAFVDGPPQDASELILDLLREILAVQLAQEWKVPHIDEQDVEIFPAVQKLAQAVWLWGRGLLEIAEPAVQGVGAQPFENGLDHFEPHCERRIVTVGPGD